MATNPFSAAANGVAEQCVAWVEQVFSGVGFEQTGPATAAEYATSGSGTYGSLQNQGWQQTTPSNVGSGDIVVLQPGTLGVGSAGHIAVVTGTTSSGINISQANSAGSSSGSPPTSGFIPFGSLSGAGVSLWQAPQQLVAQASQLAQSSAIGLTSSGSLSGGGGSSSGSSSSSSSSSGGGSSPAGCQSLADIFSESGASAVLGDIPIIGLAWKSATAPEKFISWALQPCVRWRMVFWLGVLVGSGIGLHLLLKDGSGSSPVTQLIALPGKMLGGSGSGSGGTSGGGSGGGGNSSSGAASDFTRAGVQARSKARGSSFLLGA